MVKVKLLAALAFAFVVGACGNKPLTDEQKARLSETFQDISQSSTAVQGSMDAAANRGVQRTSDEVSLLSVRSLLMATPRIKNLPAPFKKMFGGFFGLNDLAYQEGLQHTFSNDLAKEWVDYRIKRAREREGRMKQVQAKLEERFVDKSCSLPKTDLAALLAKAASAGPGSGSPTNQNAPDFSGVQFRIMGDKCPVYAEFKVEKADVQQGRFSSKFAMKFEVKDPELLEISDLQSMDVVVESSVNVDASESASSGNSNMSMEGTLVTKTEGEIKLKMKSSSDASIDARGSASVSASTTSEMEFKDFSVEVEFELSMNVDAGGAPQLEQKLTVNGEDVKAEDLQTLLGIGADGKPLPNQPGDAAPEKSSTPPPSPTPPADPEGEEN